MTNDHLVNLASISIEKKNVQKLSLICFYVVVFWMSQKQDNDFIMNCLVLISL